MMTVKEYKAKYNSDDSAPGWDAIDEHLSTIYKNEPRHYGTILKYMLGGKDPLDGVSVYDNDKQEKHLHLISYGMSELYYNEEAFGKEFSNWGF